MNKIIFEKANGLQPWVVYDIKGKKKTFRAAFSTKERAQEWVTDFGGWSGSQ